MQKAKFLWRGIIVVLCLSLLMGAVFTGCVKDTAKESGTPDQTGETKPEPLDISMTMILYPIAPPDESNIIIKKVEEYTNTKLNINWIPDAAYNDRITTSLAAMDLPEVLLVRSDKEPVILNALRSDVFWEIGSYIKEFSNLENKLSKIVFNNISVEGKIYGLYRTRDLARRGLIYRKDYADAIGLEEPKTTDDLYPWLKTLAESDPDGNKQNDTYALEMNNQNVQYATTALSMWYGAPNTWGLKDGKVVNRFTTAEYLESMKVLRKLYSENLINHDFPVNAKPDYLVKGTACAVFTVIGNAQNFQRDVQKLDPNATFSPIGFLQGTKGTFVPAENGYNGQFLFPKKTVKNEEHLKKLLGYFDKLLDQEIIDLFKWGIKDLHYSLVDGVPQRSQEQVALFEKDASGMDQLAIDTNIYPTPGVLNPLEKKILDQKNEMMKHTVANICVPYTSETNLERGAELDKIINDTIIKFVIGEIDEEGWNKEIEGWLKAGGEKVQEEYTLEYLNAHK